MSKLIFWALMTSFAMVWVRFAAPVVVSCFTVGQCTYNGVHRSEQWK
jgi:hypothetical protein